MAMTQYRQDFADVDIQKYGASRRLRIAKLAVLTFAGSIVVAGLTMLVITAIN